MFATHLIAFMDWKPEYFKFGHAPVRNNPILQRMSRIAKELSVVPPVGLFRTRQQGVLEQGHDDR